MPNAEAELNIISRNHHGIVECCSSMFELWIQTRPNASWKTLIEALKKLNLTNLAAQVERLFDPSINTDSTSVAARLPILGND